MATVIMEFTGVTRRRSNRGDQDRSIWRKLRLETNITYDWLFNEPSIPNYQLAPSMREKYVGYRKTAIEVRRKNEAILKEPKANYVCASACFFIFVAGIDRQSGEGPLLGIHRPYLSEADLKRLSGDQVINSQDNKRKVEFAKAYKNCERLGVFGEEINA